LFSILGPTAWVYEMPSDLDLATVDSPYGLGVEQVSTGVVRRLNNSGDNESTGLGWYRGATSTLLDLSDGQLLADLEWASCDSHALTPN